jgi:HK97 family phage portal protein
MMGSVQTVTGKAVSEETALRFAAVCAATRIISETLASLPLNTLEQVDARTTNKAIGHPLYKILHDVPNPEQDSMTFFDQQTAFTTNWGNCFAEIQRSLDGEIAALWPIHPSRIPLRNITRNPTDPADWHTIVAGEPGEIVYWVKNDDGTTSPIPKADMLHVPGVLSSNGITGQSIIRLAANSIGIGMATEEHAGALFKNGAVSNIALTSLKPVGKERAEYLRKQWQECFGGVQNHYKTLLLEDGVTPVPINMNPEQTQLIMARQFSVTEIARWYRLPPHLLADLSRSTFANIEAENLSFVVHSMLPWIVRWEKALYRQLLTPDEQSRYRFKFNVNGLLRGDTAARAQFYQVMFNLGAFSPNDIRSREDENPIPGGDTYFIQGNNAVPLDKADELADAKIESMTKPDPAPAGPSTDPALTNHLAELRRLQEKMIVDVELRDASKATREDVKNSLAELARQQDESTRAVDERISSLSTTLNEQGERIGVVIAQEVAKITESVPKIEDLSRFLTTTLDTTMRPVVDLTSKLEASVNELREHGDAERDATVDMIVKQAQSIRDDVTNKVSPLIDKLDAVPQIVEQAVQALANQASEVRDTTETDEIAAKKAEIDRKSAEIEQKLAAERLVTDQVLTAALKRSIDSLAAREAKGICGAREQPRTLPEWRAKFYPEFRRRFEHELAELVTAAAACEITLDLPWGADRWSEQSISDLKTLDADAADNNYDVVKAKTDEFVKHLWGDRSQALAVAMITRGRQEQST